MPYIPSQTVTRCDDITSRKHTAYIVYTTSALVKTTFYDELSKISSAIQYNIMYKEDLDSIPI